jgi:integrase
MSLRDLSKRFLEWKDTAQLEAKSQRYYEYGWKLLAASSLAPLQLSRITTDEVAATRFVGLTGKPIGGQYANQAIRTLRVMLNKAREWRLIAEVPVLKMRKAAGRQLLFSAEDEAGILKHASRDVQDVFVQIQDTGMRPNEVFRMRWEDVFFNEDYIFVPESKTEAGRRKVPISDRLRQRLWERRKSAKSVWVYPGRNGEGHLQSVAVGFRNARRRAGVDKRKVLYTARHTFGTYALAASQNLPAVMKTMGHASVNSTLPYQHHGMESIRAAIEARNGAGLPQAERSPQKTAS